MLKFGRLCFLFFCFQFSMLLCAQSSIKEKILFYDNKYSTQYCGNVDPALDYFNAYGFKLMNTPEILKWIDEKIKSASCGNTVVLQLSDITSKELVMPWDKTSSLYRYCKAGGRWVAPGGTTLSGFEGAKDLTFERQGAYHKDNEKYITRNFGIHRIYGLKGKGQELTVKGKTWGLSAGNNRWMLYLLGGVPDKDVSPLVKSKKGNVALVWLKNINSKYPYSGLVGMSVRLSSNEAMLRTIHKLCVFNGKPLKIQRISWKAKKITPDIAISFNASQAGIPRKAYQRGEIIPLFVKAYGKKYSGQKIEIKLNKDGKTIWNKIYPSTTLKSFSSLEKINTNSFNCGEYSLTGIIDGKKLSQQKIWICPARRNNSFPLFICKMHRKNPAKESQALDYVRDNNLNVIIYDLYQMVGTRANSKSAPIFGNYLDLLLRKNLSAGARPNALNLYTKKKNEELVLYDGSVHKHGVNRYALSWRGFVAAYLDSYRMGLKQQVALLRNSKSPAIEPYFITNDDGSMGGNYDFNPVTMADFKKATGLTRKDLPVLKKVKYGNHVFMPMVSPGVIDDKHPWLQYFRFHCADYNKIADNAMKAVTGEWPGSMLGDIGCMSGPFYIPRGFYPPLSFKAYNTASFYQYLFWLHQYPFAIELARMGNKDKPVGLTISASWIPWGKTFQEGMLYRIIAESPLFIALWTLDSRRLRLKELEDDCWKGNKSFSSRIAKVSEFLKLQKITPRKGALFFGLAQSCFRTKDPHGYPYYMGTALEHFQLAGAKLDLVSTEEIQDGILKNYDIVFVNDHQWITKETKKRLENYIKKGGVVVVDKNTTIAIDGAIKADGSFGAGLGDFGKADRIKLCKKYVNKYLKPAKVRSVGKNTVIRVNSVKNTPIAWVIDVETQSDIAGLKKAQSTDWNKGVYKFLKERVRNTPTVVKNIMIKSDYFAYDIWNNKELKLKKVNGVWNAAQLTVNSLTAVPILLYKDKINKITTESSKTLSRGNAFNTEFKLVSDKNILVKGIVPAKVTVYAPDGKEVWEYGGNTVIKDGLLKVNFKTAVNDISGTWKINVKELCSGKIAEMKLNLK